MKLPKYAESKHGHKWETAQYAIDWDYSNERKYKQICEGLRVYEDGTVKVNTLGDRKPALRRYLETELGVRIKRVADITGRKFYMPDGTKVAKKHIKQTGLLWDTTLNRGYVANYHRGGSITLLHENAEPVAYSKVSLGIPNKARASAVMKRIEDHMALGQTLSAMDGNNYGYYRPRYLGYDTERAILNPPTDMSSKLTQDFCKTLFYSAIEVYDYVQEVTEDKYEVPYLLIKEK